MKPQPVCHACGGRAIRACQGCGTPVCEEHQRLSVNASGQKQYLCFACDDRRHQNPAPWPFRR